MCIGNEAYGILFRVQNYKNNFRVPHPATLYPLPSPWEDVRLSAAVMLFVVAAVGVRRRRMFSAVIKMLICVDIAGDSAAVNRNQKSSRERCCGRVSTSKPQAFLPRFSLVPEPQI